MPGLGNGSNVSQMVRLIRRAKSPKRDAQSVRTTVSRKRNATGDGYALTLSGHLADKWRHPAERNCARVVALTKTPSCAQAVDLVGATSVIEKGSALPRNTMKVTLPNLRSSGTPLSATGPGRENLGEKHAFLGKSTA